MTRPLACLSFVLACSWLPTAQASEAALRACRQIADNQQRWACYDAIPLPEAPTARPAAGSAGPAGAAAAAGTTATAPAGQAAVSQFGFEQRAAAAQAQFIDSSIPGRFSGWDPGDRIRLANGQVWRIADDSRAVVYRTDPKVRIRRGALGAFYLEVEGSSQSPRVTRVE